MIESSLIFHHLGVAVASIPKAVPVYESLFGYQLASGPFDDPIQQVSVCFLRRELPAGCGPAAGCGPPADIVVELVAPLGEDSPIHRTLKKGGNSAYHVCYETGGLEQTLEQLAAQGCLIVSPPVPAVAFGNRRIAWLYTPTRQLIELLEKTP